MVGPALLSLPHGICLVKPSAGSESSRCQLPVAGPSSWYGHLVADQPLTAASNMTEAHVERQSSAIAALQSVDVETIFDKVRHPEVVPAMFVDFASDRRAQLCFTGVAG